MEETLEDRMKKYEKEFDKTIPADKWAIIRLDGKNFSKSFKFTKLPGIPFCRVFHLNMIETCKALFEEICDVKLIWTGSDEISLLMRPTLQENAWYRRRIFKWLSLSSSIASVAFNRQMLNDSKTYHFYNNKNVETLFPVFDSKVFVFPSIEEAINDLIYRQHDLKRNSISEYYDSMFSKKSAIGLNSDQKMKRMYEEEHFDWSKNAEDWTKFGSILYKMPVEHKTDNGTPYIRNEIQMESKQIIVDEIKYLIS